MDAVRDQTGSCHCAAVTFRITAPITDVYRCDCSLCRMKNALMISVHESSFELLAGAEVLSEYNWNTGVARHFFCSKCGIYPFHRKRTKPDHYGINVSCLTGFDPSGIRVRQAEGSGMSVKPAAVRDLWTGPREG
jgi:hypothetical protein